MKIICTLVILFAVCVGLVAIKSCANKSEYEMGEKAVQSLFSKQADSLITTLAILNDAVTQKKSIDSLQKIFTKNRNRYKEIEGIVEYYFQGLTKRINGAALPDVKPEDGQVWPPHGFQVIEQILYSNYNDTSSAFLKNEIKILQTDMLFVKANMIHNAILPQHAKEIIQHQLIRIAALGISGFDSPISQQSLPEAAHSLLGLQKFFTAYYSNNTNENLEEEINKNIKYLAANNDFDTFNRAIFLSEYLMPLSQFFVNYTNTQNKEDSVMVKSFNGTLADLIKGKGFNADYFSNYASSATSPSKVALGKKLFNDKALSNSNSISCATCHQQGKFYTDGKTKAENFVHGGILQRNTPTLYYAALQSNQFYDLRSITLEDQVEEVIKNKDEFNFSSSKLANKIYKLDEYNQLFKKAFGVKDSISGYELRNALAAFIRSLTPFTAKIDNYFKGNKQALNNEEINGFNLFMGKAKCGTCHFMPVFNGNVPPFYNKSESEIIGVPSVALWKNAGVDKDSGRYRINKMNELMFAFKTPTIRNVEKTAPYMHNGVYKTLDEVVEFYHRGGGNGIGLNNPFQSLPFDSLKLAVTEKKALVSFMKTLTDTNENY